MDKASIKNSVIISLLLVKSILSFGQNYDPEKVSIATLTQKIGDISVDIAQYKPIDYIKSKFYCYAEIRIYKNKIMIDSLVFDDIEPVGGHYGLLVYPSLIMNHLIISKYGDYDGRTIIINDQGQIFSTIGGSVSIDYQSGFLFY